MGPVIRGARLSRGGSSASDPQLLTIVGDDRRDHQAWMRVTGGFFRREAHPARRSYTTARSSILPLASMSSGHSIWTVSSRRRRIE